LKPLKGSHAILGVMCYNDQLGDWSNRAGMWARRVTEYAG